MFLCFSAMDAVWPAASIFGCCDSPTMVDLNLKLGANFLLCVAVVRYFVTIVVLQRRVTRSRL